MTTYNSQNEAKRSFDHVYSAETPHDYLDEMSRLGYQIGEQARPYCVEAAQFLADENPGWPIRMLDVGCSYGIGAAFVKYGCTFEELVSFFKSRAPSDYTACVAATRAWINVVPPQIDMGVVGLDVSEGAVQFAGDSGLLDAGFVRNLEEDELSEDERAWIGGCNLLMCTGAIGYVSARTFEKLLAHLGKLREDRTGPVAVLTILRMFDPSGIRDAFREAGWEFRRVRGVRLPQRAFADEAEQARVLGQLRRRGLDPEGWESHGVYYADMFVASLPRVADRLEARMRGTDEEPPMFTSHVAVATAREAAAGS